MRLLRGVRVALALAGLCAHVAAQGAAAPEGSAYPTKPVRLIVPFAPGGTNDILGRMIATDLGARLGQTFIVDNRPGADGAIGTEHVMKANPDGYTAIP
jgi:tripartite-type tricarboxylate transporter receptor subunit TctC